MWIQDDTEFVTHKVGKTTRDGEYAAVENRKSKYTETIGSASWNYHRPRRGRLLPLIPNLKSKNSSGSDDAEARESRDACPEIPLLTSLRDDYEANYLDDLDEVIAKIVQKRDELLREKAVAEEEIKRLRLENENLKNLHSISKRIAATQREELAKLKVNAEHDAKKMRALEKAVYKMKARTDDIRHALDGSDFLEGIATCSAAPPRQDQRGSGPSAPSRKANSGVLDSFFGWTIESDV